MEGHISNTRTQCDGKYITYTCSTLFVDMLRQAAAQHSPWALVQKFVGAARES